MSDPDLIDWRERHYLSQYAPGVIGLSVHIAGVPGDATGPVTATLTRQLADGTTATVGTYTATHPGVGMYEVTIPPADTSVPGDYALQWSYSIASVAQSYVVYLVIGQANQYYDALTDDFKALLETVFFRFADLFDSSAGGPNLQMYYQTHWSRGRVAQLMNVALGLLNTMAQPFSTFTLSGQGGSLFPIAQWGALLATATYVECVKHLIRSYVEQPMVAGASSITRLDRRDYMDRWRSILDMEADTLKSQMEVWKISMMQLGRPRVLVGGGVYGRYAPTRVAGSAAARPRYYARFY
jgi:hypothetical protein